MKYLILNLENEKSRFSRRLGDISPFDAGIPLFDCADETIREIYYYRWHLYCKHIRPTPEGYVVTEFYPPVAWAKKYNTICCPAGHHLYEGRWLHDTRYVNDYAKFWFAGTGAMPRDYSFWAADAIWKMCQVRGDYTPAETLYDALKENYAAWEETHLRDCGLFYQIDDRDGMEFSAGGSGLRPTINSYMYGDALALSAIATRLGKVDEAELYAKKAEKIRTLVEEKLWDAESVFYKTRTEEGELVPVREQIGYVPWYFNLPGEDKSEAWKFLTDETYFAAPYGPTTAERICPDFMKWFDHECLWNGPSWPYATAQTLTALGNLLCNYNQDVMKNGDYYQILHTYAASHYDTLPDGTRVPYLDENLDPFTGEWLARKFLHETENPPGGADRGIHYNHSSYCDLVLTGLVGLRVRTDEVLQIRPLFEETDMAYLCADGILYHGHSISLLWDKDGSRYGKGKGLKVYCDGKCICSQDGLTEIKMNLSEVAL